MYAKKSVSMKVVALLLAVVLLIGCAVGSTVAYLMAKSAVVTNTFVAGEIGTLNLSETTGNSYIVTPGVDITKDPTVTFNGNNVAAYVFLKVEATDWTVSSADTTYTYSLGNNEEMKWTIADGWTKLENVDGVYYRTVAADTDTANTADAEKYGIIKENTITVRSEITKENIDGYTKGLTFTAYAIQKDGFTTVSDAWTQAQTATN